MTAPEKLERWKEVNLARAALSKALRKVAEQFALSPEESLSIQHQEMTGAVNELLRREWKQKENDGSDK